MILLVASLARSTDCASALQEATNEATHVAASLREAAAFVQEHECSAAVIDQLLLDSYPDEAEALYKHLGPAVPVYVNFALCGMERVTRELRFALDRRSREMLRARQEAQQALHHRLNETITALLLSCEMAMQVPGLPAAAEAKMRAIDSLAHEMKGKLMEA